MPPAGMREFVDDMILIDDAQLREALRIARDTTGLILEPAGALGIAAALQHQIPGRKLATVVTGSNFSADLLAELTTESCQHGGAEHDANRGEPASLPRARSGLLARSRRRR
jgi:threonine dehydratase